MIYPTRSLKTIHGLSSHLAFCGHLWPFFALWSFWFKNESFEKIMLIVIVLKRLAGTQQDGF